MYATRHQEKKHDKQFWDYLDGNHSELLRRSAFGLTHTYNSLPQSAVNSTTVRAFQRFLQKGLKEKVKSSYDNWENYYNSRKERVSSK